MTILTSTQAVPFKAPWRENDPEAVTFYLRAGTVIERGLMEAEIAGDHRAGLVHGYELRAAVTSGIQTLLDGDPDHDRVLELFEQELEHEVAKVAAAAKEEPEPSDPLTPEDRRLLGEVRNVLAEHWPEYRALIAQMERRRAVAPIVALKRFCTNIVGAKVKFTKGVDGLVSDKTLAALDPQEMTVAGSRAFGLQYGPGEEKNSGRPSPSDDSPKPTTSAEPSKEAGRSRGRAGRKTPA
jgi:hypothetical protein